MPTRLGLRAKAGRFALLVGVAARMAETRPLRRRRSDTLAGGGLAVGDP